MISPLRGYDVAATCQALHRAPLPGVTYRGLTIEWCTARPTHDRTAANVYAFVVAAALSERQVKHLFGLVLKDMGAQQISVRRARRAKDVEADSAALVAQMLGAP